MQIYGLEFALQQVKNNSYQFKLVANENAIHFFPHIIEHRDATQLGLCYMDDSKGNALAGMVNPNSIELRFHKSFSDERVRNLTRLLFSLPEITPMKDFTVSYQGRVIINP